MITGLPEMLILTGN